MSSMKYWMNGEISSVDNPACFYSMILYPHSATVYKSDTNDLYVKFLDSAGNPVTGLTVTGLLTKPDTSTENLTYVYSGNTYVETVEATWTGITGRYNFTAETTIGGIVYSVSNKFYVDILLSELSDQLKKHDQKMSGLIVDSIRY